jgi:uncharacterized protein
MAGKNKKDRRGFASMDPEKQREIASKGGSAQHEERGLQAADEETRERVARAGGESSHSGGRKKKSGR